MPKTNLSTAGLLFVELSKLFDLPKRAVSLDLHMQINELPRVTVTYYPESPAEAEVTTLASYAREFALNLKTVTKQFEITEICSIKPVRPNQPEFS